MQVAWRFRNSRQMRKPPSSVISLKLNWSFYCHLFMLQGYLCWLLTHCPKTWVLLKAHENASTQLPERWQTFSLRVPAGVKKRSEVVSCLSTWFLLTIASFMFFLATSFYAGANSQASPQDLMNHKFWGGGGDPDNPTGWLWCILRIKESHFIFQVNKYA